MSTFYRRRGKRLLDLAVAIPALLLLAPLLAFVTLMVRLRMGAPVFFRQVRPGLHEKPFPMVKFRTMAICCDGNGDLLPESERLTRLGRFLRATSLDELPELLNIVAGDMSIVGPRPLLTQYLPYYTDRERLRHAVRPGLTGLAQINGRNNLDWARRLELDVQYVEQLSFRTDLLIFMRTIGKVLTREDIAVPKRANLLDVQRRANRPPREEVG